jgi:hypothetical protein
MVNKILENLLASPLKKIGPIVYKGSTQIVLVTLAYGKQDLRKLACKPFKESFNFWHFDQLVVMFESLWIEDFSRVRGRVFH